MIDFKKKYQKSEKGLLLIAPTGAGKTKKSLEAIKGESATIVAPASLSKTFAKEEKKWFKKTTPRVVETFAGMAREHKLPSTKHLIIDEIHNIRNPKTQAYKALKSQRSRFDKVLGLTATPSINFPYDLSAPVRLIAGKNVVPADRKTFNRLFYKTVTVKPSFIQRLKGIKPGEVKILRDPRLVKAYFGKYVHKEPEKKYTKLLPKKTEEIVRVPMGKKQMEVYSFIERTLPRHLRKKVWANLPPSKKELKDLNAYFSGLRAASNTARAYIKEGTYSTKLDKIVEDTEKELKAKGKVIIYSNFRESGIRGLKKRLTEKKIPFSSLVGDMSKSQRAEQVKKYTTPNKTNVFLTTAAGSEGLNLPKTTAVLLTEPHFNLARLTQAAGRGIRRSAGPDKVVKVKTYISTVPKKKHFLSALGFKPKKPRGSVDEYLLSMSKRKEQESKTFLKALES